MNEQRHTATLPKPAVWLMLGLMMIGVAWWLTRPDPKIRRQRQEFFAVNGGKLLDQEERRNREAVERARRQLASNFAYYRSGVPRFAADLTTWGTSYRIAKASLTDWWSKSNETRKVATGKFATLVVSDEQLDSDVAALVAQFRSDLEANRNTLLSELAQKVATAEVPCASTGLGSTNLTRAFMLEAQPLVAQRAVKAPLVLALATGGGWMAQSAATAIVTKLVSSMAARIAAGAAAEGSAVAAGAVKGGAGGTILEPGVGTAVGIVGGIVAGCAVDWWMEKQFKEKVTNECNQMLNDMERELWANPSQGLFSSFSQAVTITRQCHETALRKIITGSKT